MWRALGEHHHVWECAPGTKRSEDRVGRRYRTWVGQDDSMSRGGHVSQWKHGLRTCTLSIRYKGPRRQRSTVGDDVQSHWPSCHPRPGTLATCPGGSATGASRVVRARGLVHRHASRGARGRARRHDQAAADGGHAGYQPLCGKSWTFLPILLVLPNFPAERTVVAIRRFLTGQFGG